MEVCSCESVRLNHEIALLSIDMRHLMLYVARIVVCFTVWTDCCKASYLEVLHHLMQARSNAEFTRGPTQAVLLEG